jgi:hypothetical protein
LNFKLVDEIELNMLARKTVNAKSTNTDERKVAKISGENSERGNQDGKTQDSKRMSIMCDPLMLNRLFFVLSFGYMLPWTSLGSLISHYKFYHGADFYIQIYFLYYLPGLPVALLQFWFDDKVDSWFGSQNAYLFRGIVSYGVMVAALLFMTGSDDNESLYVAFFVLGMSAWFCHGSASVLAAMHPHGAAANLQIGFRCPEVYAVIASFVFQLDAHATQKNMDSFYILTAVLVALALACWVVVVASGPATTYFKTKDNEWNQRQNNKLSITSTAAGQNNKLSITSTAAGGTSDEGAAHTQSGLSHSAATSLYKSPTITFSTAPPDPSNDVDADTDTDTGIESYHHRQLDKNATGDDKIPIDIESQDDPKLQVEMETDMLLHSEGADAPTRTWSLCQFRTKSRDSFDSASPRKGDGWSSPKLVHSKDTAEAAAATSPASTISASTKILCATLILTVWSSIFHAAFFASVPSDTPVALMAHGMVSAGDAVGSAAATAVAAATAGASASIVAAGAGSGGASTSSVSGALGVLGNSSGAGAGADIAQQLYFMRLFADLVGRPLTFLPRPWFAAVRRIFVFCFDLFQLIIPITGFLCLQCDALHVPFILMVVYNLFISFSVVSRPMPAC